MRVSMPVVSDVPAWAQQTRRWAQVAFVEDDPAHYDPAFWLDYFKRVHATGALLSAGGCVAFYPTQIDSIIAAHGWATRTPSAT